MAKNYDALADSVVELVGGKDNVRSVVHCITRLRFNLKDKSAVELDEIKKIPGTMGAQWAGDQLQIIIGQDVDKAYDAICKKYAFQQQKTVNENLDAPKKKFTVGAFMDAITGCIAPIIPVMIACGMLKALLQVLSYAGVLSVDGSTYNVLSVVGDVGFYFLPVIIGYTAAKKFNVNVFIGMALGACLIHPNFTAMINAGDPITLFGLPVYSGYYPSSIFPMILTIAVAAPIEKFINKVIPSSLRYVLVPTLTLMVVAPLELIVLAPLGAYAGSYLAAAIVWLYNATGFIGCAILAAIYPTMHISNYNQIAACLAVGLKSKDSTLKQSAFSCALTALIGGVTEPALFGITIPLKTPLYGCMIGGLVGGAVLGLKKVVVYSLPGAGTIFGLPAYIGGGSLSNLMWMGICIVIGMVSTFVATMVLYKPEQK